MSSENTPNEDSPKPTPTNETTDTEDTEKSEDISVFDLETFQKQLSRLDGKKQKTTIVLADTTNIPGPSCERDKIGDDMNKKEQEIVCECEPNVAGAAVPAVCSFNNSITENLPATVTKSHVFTKSDEALVSDNSQIIVSEKSESSKTERPREDKTTKSLRPKNSNISNRRTVADNLKENEKVAPKINQKKNFIAENIKQISQTDNHIVSKKTLFQRQDIQIKKQSSSSKDNITSAHRNSLRKPSMIPKPTRPSTTCGIRMDSSDKISLTEKNSCVVNKTSSNSLKSRLPVSNASSASLLANEAMNISEKMLDLKERLKQTTNLLRRKINSNTKPDGEICVESCPSRGDIPCNQEPKTALQELNGSIYKLETTALTISSGCDLVTKKYMHQLLNKVNEIKEISKNFTMDKNGNTEKLSINNENLFSTNSRSSQTKDKENKIHIKFMKNKEICERRLKKESEKLPNMESISTNPVKEVEQPRTICEDKTKADSKVKETDSMDGVFIPSCEPPKNIEDEEEETNGLDITITFPDINSKLLDQDESLLSVKLSNISEEVLRKLKRCPKDFTLRMDFVQGKIAFQSGKAPINNFSIGPDLKFTEHPVRDLKSEIIDIKPSTECGFTSEIIPVENNNERISMKSLKSTDSELFKVVKLPFIYKSPSMNTVTKSCITFQNDNIFSMAIIARHVFKSMPHIASLSNLFEDRFVNLHNSVLHSTEKRKKNRPSSKKAITSSVVM